MPTINSIGTPEITLGGTFTMAGGYTFVGTLTGNTTVTFPTSGTLATTGGSVLSITGTANQVLANGTSGTPVTGGNITLTTPQDIATTSNVEFESVTTFNTIQALGGNITAGANGTSAGFYSFASTINTGQLSLVSADNSGNYLNLISNIATTAARTWRFPDASGTVALTGSSAETFDGDSGSATPSGGVVTFTGASTGLTFTGSGSTLTLGGTLAPSNGGTGVNNGSNTLTLAGNLATSGTFASTFTMTGATSVTFPTSGTLATSSATVPGIIGTANQVLANGTSGSAVSGTNVTLTTPQSIATTSSVTFANVTATSTLMAGNIEITANTIESTNSNGPISIIPNNFGSSSTNGQVLVGSTTSYAGFVGIVYAQMQIAQNNNQGILSLGAFVGNSGGPSLFLTKSRNTTIGSFTAVHTNDALGNINFLGDDGAAYQSAALITGQATGTISSGIVPGAINFYTANTSGALTLGMTLSNAQVLSLANPLPSGSGGTGVNALGTGVATALGQNVNGSGAISLTTSPTLVTPALGTPSAGVLSSCTGYAQSALTGLGTGVSTALAANVTGSGSIVLANAPTFVTGTITAPSITFSSTSGIIGTTTNDSAAAGSVGEFVIGTTTSGSPVSLMSQTVTNIITISLTAGDWDVWGSIGIIPNSSTLIGAITGGVSLTSATLPADDLRSTFVSTGTAFVVDSNLPKLSCPAVMQRISVATTTTVYMAIYCDFTVSTCSAYGNLQARRRR